MNSHDLFYFISAISIGLVSLFLCWVLYEVATLVHRSNAIVDDVTQKIQAVEETLEGFVQKIQNPLNYLGLLAGSGKTILSALQGKKKQKKSALFDDDNES